MSGPAQVNFDLGSLMKLKDEDAILDYMFRRPNDNATMYAPQPKPAPAPAGATKASPPASTTASTTSSASAGTSAPAPVSTSSASTSSSDEAKAELDREGRLFGVEGAALHQVKQLHVQAIAAGT